MPSTKKALLIGINYIGSEAELSGCINDVHNVKDYLIDNKGFESENIVLLTEETNEPPTKWNIIKNLITLKWKAESGDTIYIHYSGHGGQSYDKTGDEKDFIDETLVPLDYLEHGDITDDLIYRYFLKYMPSGVNILMVMDACHSGTVCDLKYNYNVGNVNSSVKIHENYRDTRCNVVMISGCKDKQTSMDAYINGSYQGAMTNAFLNTLKILPNDSLTFNNIIISMRTQLFNTEYTQIPQLSSGRSIDINKKLDL